MKINDQIITSRSNPLIVQSAKLNMKKERDATGRFLCDGKKLSFEYIKKCGAAPFIFVNENNMSELKCELERIEHECGCELTVTVVGEGAFSKLTEQRSPDGIILVGEKSRVGYGRIEADAHAYDGQRIIILSSLQDSGNVGTVIRTALALGYDRVILSDDCADVFSPKTLRAAMGAVFSMNISMASDLCDAVGSFVGCGRRVFAAELRENAISIDDISIKADDIFIIGNEGHGIPSSVSGLCSASAYIPISEKSESLNAATAAAVMMWQQRSESFK